MQRRRRDQQRATGWESRSRRRHRYRLTQCAGFLTFLIQRGHGIEQCRQADVDAWFADGPVGRRLTAAFLHWCIQQKAMPRLKIPNIVTANPVPISQHRRLALIRHLIDDEQIALLAASWGCSSCSTPSRPAVSAG